jgi:hypothetical protein
MEEYEVVRVVFVMCVAALIVTGFYLSAKLTGAIPEPIRIAILSPSLAGIAYAIGLLKFSYVPYWHDVFAICATLSIYFFVASLFSEKPWVKFGDDK